jgi:DNA-binding protein HU-beta
MKSTLQSNDSNRKYLLRNRNKPMIVIAPLATQSIRIAPNSFCMAILMVVMILTTMVSLVAAFVPLEAHTSSHIFQRRSSCDVGLLLQRQHQPHQSALKSTPTEESDATNDPTLSTATKAADNASHFLKPDFIDAIHKKTGMTKKESENLYKIFFEIITEQLLESATTDPSIKMKIPKFGTFFIKLRPERSGKNPRTGEPITIAASKIPSFTPASTLKDLMNGKAKSSSSTKKNGDDDDDDEDDNE